MAVVVFSTRYVSLGSIAAAYAVGSLWAVNLARSPESDAALLLALGAGSLVALKHADNVQRLRRGRERHLGKKPGG